MNRRPRKVKWLRQGVLSALMVCAIGSHAVAADRQFCEAYAKRVLDECGRRLEEMANQSPLGKVKGFPAVAIAGVGVAACAAEYDKALSLCMNSPRERGQ